MAGTADSIMFPMKKGKKMFGEKKRERKLFF